MAVRLGQAGIAYTVVDKNDAVGGTWHENTYPGCGVDTPSHLYALSFDPNPDWGTTSPRSPSSTPTGTSWPHATV
ncbi:NAD(P)-binding protein [Gordonia humi]|uniref:NAD(P)-binding protein n=1 Tax=Gordonia humi TaxID=686429 RepID=UPI003610E8D0